MSVIPTDRSHILRGREPHLEDFSIPRTHGRQSIMGIESVCKLLTYEYLAAGWSRWKIARSDRQSKGGTREEFSRHQLQGKGAHLV